MSITSIPKKLDESDPAVKSFLEPRKKEKDGSRRDMLRAALSDAFAAPDKPFFGGQPAQAEQPSPVVARIQPQKGRDRRPVRKPRPEPVSNENLRSAEKTYSVDPEKHDLMVMYANMEGLRLGKNVPTSRIHDALLGFALSFVDPDRGEVIPTTDGHGLHLGETGRS